jgi:hypothetical protein
VTLVLQSQRTELSHRFGSTVGMHKKKCAEVRWRFLVVLVVSFITCSTVMFDTVGDMVKGVPLRRNKSTPETTGWNSWPPSTATRKSEYLRCCSAARSRHDTPLLAKAKTSVLTAHSQSYIHPTRAETSPDELARYPEGKAAIGNISAGLVRGLSVLTHREMGLVEGGVSTNLRCWGSL